MCREKAGSNVSLCAPADGLTAPSLSLSFFACAKCHISLLRHKNHDKRFRHRKSSRFIDLRLNFYRGSKLHHPPLWWAAEHKFCSPNRSLPAKEVCKNALGAGTDGSGVKSIYCSYRHSWFGSWHLYQVSCL